MKKILQSGISPVPLGDGYSPIERVSVEGYKPSIKPTGTLEHTPQIATGGYQPLQTADNPANKIKPPVKK